MIRRTVLLAEVVDTENVGMVERRDRASFLLEATQAVGVGGKRSGENLDRHVAAKALVTGAIDFAHSASTN